MSSFYIELSSNARYLDNYLGIEKRNIHPFIMNTIGNFRNKINLLHPLEGNWEVGIAEISYTKSWKNLFHASYMNIAEIYSDNSNPSTITAAVDYIPQTPEEREGIIRDGYYNTVEDLCKEINEELKKFKITKLPKFCYDNITKTVYLKTGLKDDKHVIPTLEKTVSSLLGFDYYSIKQPWINKKYIVMPQRPADITAGIHTLFVYCNLVTPQYIGNTRAKLLKTVEIPGNSKFGDQIVIHYERPHYVPIIINDFHEIEIDIKDDSNHQIRFMFGRTRIKLHLRQCHI